MADFHQSGVVTTLHRLNGAGVERLERELLAYSHQRPIALVLPCLFSELRGDGLKGIVDVLRGVPYLKQLVVSIDGTDGTVCLQHGELFQGHRERLARQQ